MIHHNIFADKAKPLLKEHTDNKDSRLKVKEDTKLALKQMLNLIITKINGIMNSVSTGLNAKIEEIDFDES